MPSNPQEKRGKEAGKQITRITERDGNDFTGWGGGEMRGTDGFRRSVPLKLLQALPFLPGFDERPIHA